MRKILYIISMLFLLLSAGCTREDLLPEDNEAGSGADAAGGPFTLTFTIGVPAMESGTDTRAIFYGNPLYYEDWIDMQDGLRVLFFISKREKTGEFAVKGRYDDDDKRVASDPDNPLKDYFLFESTSRWVTQLPYDEDNNLRYRVTVPVYQIGDEESEYRERWEDIRNLLRQYNFKVAILANHPTNRMFRWGIEESVLSARDIDNLYGEKKIKTINDMHHSVADASYATGTSGREDAYKMVVDNTNKIDGVGTMGPFIDWVTARAELYGDALGGTFNSKDTARTWIRDYWIPDLIYNEDLDPDIDYQTLYHNYRHIWSYWNFGGAVADNALPYSSKSRINTHIKDWEVRNGALLREWVSDAYYNKGGVLTELNTASNDKGKYDGSMPLKFSPSSARAVITTEANGMKFYGVRVPTISAPSSTTAKDCFHFKLNTYSTITVRYSGGTVAVKTSATISNQSTTTQTVNGVQITEYQCSFDNGITEPTECFVYSSSGTPVIYDIEVTQDQYVYLTDREGILPSADHPIPMYGVQKFDNLEGYWEDGASFDLTEGGSDAGGAEYKSKTISLLRSVAKIEVLIPKSLGVPKHVYMHSLNRYVRCEPMDVATPTEELWKEHDKECEWRKIQAHGTFMGDNGTFTSDKFKTQLAWYYGNWLEWGWDFNGSQYKPTYNSDDQFPRIMNPYIGRADCAAFIDVTDYYNDQYYHYLFYMGENTIDASSQYNGNGGSATIPRIHIRFDERYASMGKMAANTDYNLMDNDCYRIYFTEGGIASGARNADGTSKIAYNDYVNSYEKKPEYLKEHWPIIRNHVYRFTIRDNGSDNMSGLVVDVENRTADFDFK